LDLPSSEKCLQEHYGQHDMIIAFEDELARVKQFQVCLYTLLRWFTRAGAVGMGSMGGVAARRSPLTTDLGFDSWTRRYTRVEFVVDSLPCFEGFSPGSQAFLSPQKSTFLNSNSIMDEGHKFIS
jgi:hypothetical protein